MKLGFKKTIFALLIMLLWCLPSYANPGESKEAGLVTHISGKVFYGKNKNEVASFMKVKVGDTFYLEENSELQLVYFASGRREKWKGPVDVDVFENEGRAATSSKNKNSPEGVVTFNKSADGVREIPDFIQNVNIERAGSATFRGLKITPKKYDELGKLEKQKVKEARERYDSMVKMTEADDIVPELYAMGTLIKYQLYEEAYGVLTKAALSKQPNNKGLTEMKNMLEKVLEGDK